MIKQWIGGWWRWRSSERNWIIHFICSINVYSFRFHYCSCPVMFVCRRHVHKFKAACLLHWWSKVCNRKNSFLTLNHDGTFFCVFIDENESWLSWVKRAWCMYQKIYVMHITLDKIHTLQLELSITTEKICLSWME